MSSVTLEEYDWSREVTPTKQCGVICKHGPSQRNDGECPVVPGHHTSGRSDQQDVHVGGGCLVVTLVNDSTAGFCCEWHTSTCVFVSATCVPKYP